ncbi:uroporphyrinogen-III synthase [Pyrobaculum aerophilum]|uniref:Uroporphyrinogen-III synthase n=1 Tax=Pyrobaculum aerophilum TaxID=13773 RepID=A0A371QU31_9CREN|nr:uroporphyrinogen-III synthase [Pyrobaculum aerophilum]RFA92624.1 uroporphyrinogen-III synthase [Pyrobaculum aerophilum]RFA98632.1 uroporphyrinogen-III synthase [Pyrobaculum aerophilum]
MKVEYIEGVGKWTVIITSGRPSKAELLAKLIIKAGGEPVYLPTVKVEESGSDISTVIGHLTWSQAVLFMTGQSAWGLAELAKRAQRLEEVRTLLSQRELLCRGMKASGNVKTHFRLECPNYGETSDELLVRAAEALRGKRLVVSFYGAVDSELLEELRKIAADVKYVQVYTTEEAPEANALEAARRFLEGNHILIFTSALGAEAFFKAVDRAGILREVVETANSGRSVIAVVGPVTEQKVRKYGVTRVIVPEKPFLAYLAEAVAEFLNKALDK